MWLRIAVGRPRPQRRKPRFHAWCQAGAVRTTTIAALLEWQRDWKNKEHYNALMGILKQQAGAYGSGVEYAYTMVHKARHQSKARSPARRRTIAGSSRRPSGGTILLDEVGEMPLADAARSSCASCRRARSCRSATPGHGASTSASSRRRIATCSEAVTASRRSGRTSTTGSPRFRSGCRHCRRSARRRLAPRAPLPARRGRASGAPARRASIRTRSTRWLQFDWPGNVRELQNEMERAATPRARRRPRSALGHLSAKLAGRLETRRRDCRSTIGPLREARAEFEARHIAGVLRRHGGNVTHAAQVLGLSRAMLQRKMKDLGLR